MPLWDAIRKALRFDEPYEEFELLETEQGAPKNVFQKPRKKNRRAPAPGGETVCAQAKLDPNERLSASLEKNLSVMKKAFCAEKNPDCIFRTFRVGGAIEACAVYLTGMADAELINEFVLRQAMLEENLPPKGQKTAEFFSENVIAISDVKQCVRFCNLIEEVLNGSTALFFEGDDVALAVETPGYERRSVQEATVEKIIRGPQEAFTENLRTNITLVRRIVRTTDLRCEFHPLGGENNLRCALVYRDGVTNESLLREVKKRLGKLNMRYMVGEGLLQQLLEERKYAPVSQVLSTERPDRVAAFVMRGHVALICDGSPFVCVLPVTLGILVNTPEDVYLRPVFGTLSRFIRYAGILMSLFLPALYVSLIMYHPDLLPIEIINTILESRRMVSLPIYLEIIFMLFLFQLMRESGVRVPGAMGQTVSIIGGLIMGQASVDAHLISSMALIVIALTGLGSYTIPMYSMQYTAIVFRLIFIFAAAVAGLAGIVIAAVISLGYFCSLKSFGVPMLAPFAPKTYNASPFVIRRVLDPGFGEDDTVNAQTEQGGAE